MSGLITRLTSSEVTAKDNVDGGISAKLEVTLIDYQKVGEQTLHIRSIDSSKNVAEK
ncbi:hypothetical protein P4U07_17865 [Bacillus mycoides]|uniref:hypothetical protein n=1 Tax=Bacillus mycoides TaxID=1405 RepID=UPI002E1FFD0A|nr:hypothetical protein [Bacillus mycoides]